MPARKRHEWVTKRDGSKVWCRYCLAQRRPRSRSDWEYSTNDGRTWRIQRPFCHTGAYRPKHDEREK